MMETAALMMATMISMDMVAPYRSGVEMVGERQAYFLAALATVWTATATAATALTTVMAALMVALFGMFFSSGAYQGGVVACLFALFLLVGCLHGVDGGDDLGRHGADGLDELDGGFDGGRCFHYILLRIGCVG
ncbi:hypothetical protein FRC98_20730 [Lujinxingia vulgaris]|uniref:Uncharacterized protein n=1 Tax=Lujinxingia vulgaris TaxID=2600176 RepID=A0A5C6X3A4_9DELT|nr:hypothetical protein [Lujinxingia vulgaris]TXD33373.1 hypothetical protein FRC98_20730 [Lujinxingia vulgaris]